MLNTAFPRYANECLDTKTFVSFADTVGRLKVDSPQVRELTNHIAEATCARENSFALHSL